jgi:hypothetical protein
MGVGTLSHATPSYTPFRVKLRDPTPFVNSSYTPTMSSVPVGSEYSSSCEPGPAFCPPLHRYPQNFPTSGGRPYKDMSFYATPINMSSSLMNVSTLISHLCRPFAISMFPSTVSKSSSVYFVTVREWDLSVSPFPRSASSHARDVDTMAINFAPEEILAVAKMPSTSRMTPMGYTNFILTAPPNSRSLSIVCFRRSIVLFTLKLYFRHRRSPMNVFTYTTASVDTSSFWR